MNNQTPVKKQTIGNFLMMPSTQKFLEENLKEKKGAFISNLLALTDGDPKLSECDPTSLMKCALNATSLNLPLNRNLGYAYVIPYRNNKKKIYEPQFQIGTKGFKQLAMRTGQYKTINHCEIREGELNINKFRGTFEFLEEKPKANIVGYIAFFELLNGYEKCLYMTNDQLEVHASKYSDLYKADKRNKTKYSKWSTDERPSMCNKTVVKLLLSREGVLSTDMEYALSKDNDRELVSKSDRSEIPEAEVIDQSEDDEKKPKKVNI